MKKAGSTLKSKIALGYFFIFLASAFAVFFLYTGIQKLQKLDQKYTVPNEKLHKINGIITLIYEAENKTRSYFLLRNKSYFNEYTHILDSIGTNIDTLKKICKNNPGEVSRLNTIQDLLSQKKEVVRQLSDLKSNRRRDKIYNRALDEVYMQAYELSKLPRIVQERIIITRDSLLSEPEKRTLLQRIFSKEKPKSTRAKSIVEKSTKSDTVIQEGITADTLVNALQRALTNLKLREDYLRELSQNTEIKLLYNDQILLDKIREIATFMESDEIMRINQALSKSSGILQQASDVALFLVILSILIIAVFLLLIFNDIKIARKNQLALQNAKQHAEELMKMKEQFIANMSHEIRTPLSTIIGYTEQLQKTMLNSQQKLYTSTIDKASDHLLDVVNDILDLSKIEAGKFMLEKVPVNLLSLIQEACDSFSLHASEKKLEMKCQIDPRLNRELLGDPFRIRQVFINIISNAIKFTEKGSIQVTAGINAINEKSTVCRIAVTDTGIGIATEKQKQIFEDFTQADSGITRKYGGTGLGLAISKRIISLHGGSINVQSSIGKGSTFTILLPLENQVESSAKQTKSITVPEPEKNFLKGKRVLTVEDDEVTLLLISSVLKDAGVITEAMTDSSKALAVAQKKTFDLILTDINMPGLSGIEFIKKIRSHADPKIANVPVIALTAYIADEKKILNEGFTDYITKPFKEALFYKKILGVWNKVVPALKTEQQEESPKKTYSLDEVHRFTGDDPDALKLVVSTFVEKSLSTLKEMHDQERSANLEQISFLAHRLLPTFRQFKISAVVPMLEKLERYKEMDIPKDQFREITNKVLQTAQVTVKQIEEEVLTQKAS